MPRWSSKIKDSIKIASNFQEPKHLLDSFYVSKIYIPQTEQEKKEFEEFSLVTSSMALLIHIAEADKIVKPEEKQRIIDDLIFQLEQRPYEYEGLSEKFGNTDKEIIGNMFDKLLHDYENEKINLNEIIRIIDLFYQNNPEKRYYLVRLCYYCALSDNELSESEKKAIKEIASKLHIASEEVERIEKEAKLELDI